MAQRSSPSLSRTTTITELSRPGAGTGTGTTELSEKYGVIAELGQGGMSVVHLATARSLGNVKKLVVLKSIRPEMITSEKVRRMFMDEARLAIRLTHPNIVQTYEVVTIAERPVIVMEYMEGQSYSTLQRAASEHGGLTLAMKLRVLIDALGGMEYAHDLSDYDGTPFGLVHRDISPQNVFVTYDGHVKILDFGIAKARDNSTHTEAGEIKGKLRYMAPEQMQGSVEVDRRADVFAMGVLLWEALTGQRLWHREKDVEVFRAVLQQGIPSPRTVDPTIDEKLEAICVKALERDVASRYATCGAMQTDLERVSEELGLRAHSKELGQLLQSIFADTRTEIRRAIERKLKEVDSAPLDLRFDDISISDSGISSSRHGSGTATPSAVELEIEVLEPPRRRGWLALAFVAVVAAGAWALLRPPPQPLAHTPVVAAPAPATTPSALPQGTMTRVQLSAKPAEATLYLDGVALPNNPFTGELPRDDSKHELRAEADGYSTRSVDMWLNGTKYVDHVLTLSKAKERPKQAGTTTERAKPRAVTPARPAVVPATPAGNCDRPFYVDAAGIRRVRAECM